jgi:hypothetical protein
VQVTIRNQARHLLICTLNSGKTIHLAPAETSQPLQQLEINGNDKIAKLVRTGLVAIATTDVKEKRAKKETEAREAKEEHTEEKTAAPVGRRQRKDKE